MNDVSDRSVTDQRHEFAAQLGRWAKEPTFIDVGLEQPVCRSRDVAADWIHGFILPMKAIVATCVYHQHLR